MGLISLTTDEFKQLSVESKNEILTLLGITFEIDTNDEFAEKLNTRMTREFMTNLSPKTKIVLQKIIDFGKSGFWLDELEKDIQAEIKEEIGGVWGGLTRRVRTVSGIDDAELIEWGSSDDGERIHGKLHPATYQNLKNFFTNS